MQIMRLHSAPLVVALLAVSVHASAQSTTGTFQGTVTDSTGAPLPGVTITIVNAQTNLTRTTTTNGSGNYDAPLLPPGRYNVSSELAGFRRLEKSGLVLEEKTLELTKTRPLRGNANTKITKTRRSRRRRPFLFVSASSARSASIVVFFVSGYLAGMEGIMSADRSQIKPLSRRELLQALAAVGITGPAAIDVIARARSSISSENLPSGLRENVGSSGWTL